MTSIPVLGLKGYLIMAFAMLLVAIGIPNMASELSAATMGATATKMAGMSSRMLGKLLGSAVSRR